MTILHEDFTVEEVTSELTTALEQQPSLDSGLPEVDLMEAEIGNLTDRLVQESDVSFDNPQEFETSNGSVVVSENLFGGVDVSYLNSEGVEQELSTVDQLIALREATNNQIDDSYPEEMLSEFSVDSWDTDIFNDSELSAQQETEKGYVLTALPTTEEERIVRGNTPEDIEEIAQSSSLWPVNPTETITEEQPLQRPTIIETQTDTTPNITQTTVDLPTRPKIIDNTVERTEQTEVETTPSQDAAITEVATNSERAHFVRELDTAMRPDNDPITGQPYQHGVHLVQGNEIWATLKQNENNEVEVFDSDKNVIGTITREGELLSTGVNDSVLQQVDAHVSELDGNKELSMGPLGESRVQIFGRPNFSSPQHQQDLAELEQKLSGVDLQKAEELVGGEIDITFPTDQDSSVEMTIRRPGISTTYKGPASVTEILEENGVL